MAQVLTFRYPYRCDLELARPTTSLGSYTRKRSLSAERELEPMMSALKSSTSPVTAASSIVDESQSSEKSPVGSLGFLKHLNPDKKPTKG